MVISMVNQWLSIISVSDEILKCTALSGLVIVEVKGGVWYEGLSHQDDF